MMRFMKRVPPWREFELSKSERKGKSVEEIQELRKRKWFEKNFKQPAKEEESVDE